MYQGELETAQALMTECLLLKRSLGDQQNIGISLNNLGNLALAQGEPVAAHTYHAESLALYRELGDQGGICDGLEGLAAAATDLQQPPRAAQLFGAAAGLREALGVPLPSFEQVIHERLRAARVRLDDRTWAAVWDQGRAMSLEEVLNYALSTGG